MKTFYFDVPVLYLAIVFWRFGWALKQYFKRAVNCHTCFINDLPLVSGSVQAVAKWMGFALDWPSFFVLHVGIRLCKTVVLTMRYHAVVTYGTYKVLYSLSLCTQKILNALLVLFILIVMLCNSRTSTWRNLRAFIISWTTWRISPSQWRCLVWPTERWN